MGTRGLSRKRDNAYDSNSGYVRKWKTVKGFNIKRVGNCCPRHVS